jgi:hypothetical protein
VQARDQGADSGYFGYQEAVALRAADAIGPEIDSASFELDRFERDGDDVLKVSGRWFGIRGRRFMRPTLTMRVDGAKHRLLADLEHKPWAAEDGEDWVASFSPAPSPGEAEEIELTVAPDIVIPLSPPSSVASGPRGNHPSSNSATAAQPASPRKARPSDRAQGALEQERAKARDLRRGLEDAEGERGRLAAQRDALAAERDGMRREQARSRAHVAELQQQLRTSEESANTGVSEVHDRLEAERAETSRLRAALDELIAERESMRHEYAVYRQRVAELREQLKTTTASAKAALSDARGNLKAERVETKKVRRALESHSAVVADRDRLARELEAAVAERNRLAAQASQPRTVSAETARVARRLSTRPGDLAHLGRPRETDWVARALVFIPLAVVLVILAIVLHLV